MTAYQNFVQDYPERCGRLLSTYFRNAQRNDLEVTLVLNIASSGFMVPYARLSEDAHPSADSIHFQQAKNSLNRLLDAVFLGSRLHPAAD